MFETDESSTTDSAIHIAMQKLHDYAPRFIDLLLEGAEDKKEWALQLLAQIILPILERESNKVTLISPRSIDELNQAIEGMTIAEVKDYLECLVLTRILLQSENQGDIPQQLAKQLETFKLYSDLTVRNSINNGV